MNIRKSRLEKAISDKECTTPASVKSSRGEFHAALAFWLGGGISGCIAGGKKETEGGMTKLTELFLAPIEDTPSASGPRIWFVINSIALLLDDELKEVGDRQDEKGGGTLLRVSISDLYPQDDNPSQLTIRSSRGFYRKQKLTDPTLLIGIDNLAHAGQLVVLESSASSSAWVKGFKSLFASKQEGASTESRVIIHACNRKKGSQLLSTSLKMKGYIDYLRAVGAPRDTWTCMSCVSDSYRSSQGILMGLCSITTCHRLREDCLTSCMLCLKLHEQTLNLPPKSTLLPLHANSSWHIGRGTVLSSKYLAELLKKKERGLWIACGGFRLSSL
ncbi:hypothetical protein Tco_1378591 [Tanacetum coccineum]